MTQQGDTAGMFFEVLSTQRACRAFTADPVDDDTIAKVLRAATYAPSAENRQPWVFVVVRDDETRAAIGEIMAELWRSGGREYTRQHTSSTVFAAADAGIGGGGIAAAPVLVVVAGDSRVVPRTWLKSSIFPATQNILLAAGALGLGSALTTLATTRSDRMRELVGMPQEVDPLAVIPLGYPARPMGPPRRDAYEQKTWRERYGIPWLPPESV